MAGGAEQIDLEDADIFLMIASIHDPLQWRVGDKAAIPIVLAFDFDGREARRQRAGSGNVQRIDAAAVLELGAVEIAEVGAFDLDRANAQPRGAAVEQVEIDQAFQRLDERRRVVERDRRVAAEERDRVGQTRLVEAIHANSRGPGGGEFVEEAAKQRFLADRDRAGAGRYQLPEATEVFDTLFFRATRNDGRIDRPDGNAGDPFGPDARRVHRLISTGLIGTQCAAALKNNYFLV